MKENIQKIAIALVFLVLFNALFFVIGGTGQSTVNWISYGFIHASYVLLLLTPVFATKGKNLNVLIASLYLRAILYFVIELLLGLFFIAIKPESINWPLIIQSVGLAIFIVMQLMNTMVNDATENSIQKQLVESTHIKTLAIQVKSALRNIEDDSLRSSVIRCYDSLNNCSIETFPEAQDAEQSLRNAVDMLCTAIEEGDNAQIKDKSKRLYNAILTRNDIIKRCRMTK